jgi:phosphoglycolate phosphatase-like HAD superfamily hydrolase
MNNQAGKFKPDGLIFSIDNVLVDVSQSYPEVVRQTVHLYLEQAVGLIPSQKPLLTLEEVASLQKMGFFTNYVDLTVAFLIYFIEMLPPVPIPTFPSRHHVPAIMAYLQMAGGRLQIGIDQLREQKDILQLADEVTAAGGGIDGADAALPKNNRHLLVVDGDITKANLTGRMFQELYLGATLFAQIYEQPAIVVQGKGFLNREPLLIEPDLLDQLSQKLPLGIVANRPQKEIAYLLESKNIEPYFQIVVSQDDVKQAKGRPLPDSWPLLEAARQLDPTPTHTAYISANPGEMQAVQAARQTVPFTGIGCLTTASDPPAWQATFEKMNIPIILNHPNELQELILD